MTCAISLSTSRFLQVTYDCWKAAIAICKPGVPYNAIGGVIEDYVTAHGLSTTRNYCGQLAFSMCVWGGYHVQGLRAMRFNLAC